MRKLRKIREIGYWDLKENQKKFFDELGKKLNIKNPSDWGEITNRTLTENKGSSLLRIYNNSLQNALRFVYPEIIWDSQWFKNKQKYKSGHWVNQENQRILLQDFASNHNIKVPSDWGSITWRKLVEYGGAPLLSKYGGSLQKALENIFPETKWENSWFYGTFASDAEKHKNFLEKLAVKLKISKPKDWGSITWKRVVENGGESVLSIYGGSLFKALQKNFPDIRWKMEWFPNLRRYPRSFWKNEESCFIFLEDLAKKHHLKNPNDWQRVSLTLIRKSGGQPLLSKYKNSLIQALKEFYMQENWDSFKIKHGRSESEESVKKLVSHIFPQHQISFNYRKMANFQ